MLIDCGFTHLGFPHFLPVNIEDTTLLESRQIIKSIYEAAIPVLITYQSSANDITKTLDYLSINYVQLHGKIDLAEIKKIKSIRSNIFIIKSIIIRNSNPNAPLNEVYKYQDYIDYFITDTYNPETGAEGATGKTHDWGISREIVKTSIKPVILAGGLNHSNISKAIDYVKPAGVDVHNGIEDNNGNKDKDKALLFVSACL